MTPPSSVPERLWFIDNLVTILLDGDHTNNGYSLTEHISRQGSMPPLHVHRVADEAFYVLDGEITAYVGGEIIRLSPGDSTLMPRGVPHTFRTETETARWLIITNPPGFERFMREVSEAAHHADLPPRGRAPGDPARLAQVAAQYDIDILGPPGTLPS